MTRPANLDNSAKKDGAVHLVNCELRCLRHLIINESKALVFSRDGILAHGNVFDGAEGEERLPESVLFNLEIDATDVHAGHHDDGLEFLQRELLQGSLPTVHFSLLPLYLPLSSLYQRQPALHLLQLLGVFLSPRLAGGVHLVLGLARTRLSMSATTRGGPLVEFWQLLLALLFMDQLQPHFLITLPFEPL